MFRLFVPGIVGFALLALWLFCIVDVISTDEVLVRNLPKLVWLMLVFFVPTIGALAWLLLGRPLYAGWRPGGAEAGPPRPPRSAPLDDRIGAEDLRRWEDDLARREDELRRRKPEDPGDDEGGDGFTLRW